MNKRDQAVLPLLLAQLRLPTMKRVWEEIAVEAESKGWSGPKYLSNLCEHEVAERDRRRLERHMAEAQLPKNKTLETYDFATISGVSKSQVLGLASGEIWIKDGMNILIFGPSGVGKTHLAAAIGEKLVENGSRVLFSRTTELVQKLQASKKALSLPAAMEKLDKYDCIILDDFGYVQKDEMETSVLFELICERYERKSLIITCNQPFKEWDRIFLDKQMAVAAVDRLVHHATILEIDAESYRRKQALNKAKPKDRNKGQVREDKEAQE
jgi:DNA replication protein DnaC